MSERHPVDEAFVAVARTLVAGDPGAAGDPEPSPVDDRDVLALFRAQALSRHVDFAARWLQARGEGFYTIASAGHEANAAVGLVTRVDDPALLHYRSGGFYAARAARHAEERPEAATDAARDLLLSLASAAADPISGGRHKVFGHAALHVVPQTSTIASHLPRAVGLGLALGALASVTDHEWPDDAIVVCSLGDASVNHSTAQGALNAAAYLTHRGLDVPVLFVCEDNGLGISTPTPAGWTARTLQALPGIAYVAAPDPSPGPLLTAVRETVDQVRSTRRPAVLHLSTVRFLGHAGSDVELAYRTRAELAADLARDPLVATARHLVDQRVLTAEGVLEVYESQRAAVVAQAERVVGAERLGTRADVMRPLTAPRSQRSARPAAVATTQEAGLTLAQAVNATLADILATHPNALVLGEDVGRKGGVYGVTRGLHRRFGGRRVVDTLLDEQTILGTALGLALAGALPIPEIQYLAYLHNAEDQLRGEAATLGFFSDGQYANPMVVRVAGLAYQSGFGGHFHNDNSVAVLRDVPGLVVCVPSHPSDAPALLRECVRLAEEDARVCVYLEPIALYHRKDLYAAGDGLWTSAPSSDGDAGRRTRRHGSGTDLLMVTFGNGLPMSLRAARELESSGVRSTVLDLRWLAPLPEAEILAVARGFPAVLVVDETRASGGVADAVVATLARAGHAARLGSVSSADSLIPLGPAAATVLLGEDEVVAAAAALVGAPG
ncbi:thiamine pyrophosphate-dependent enzyme [Nocardioides bigeumensis]|uniref:Thiamine pyrophosphate-dependent enzyme n=1 Tax=Nocardioides bigeumensis TaxID=433657 RepID=A0ABN2XP53_9ACTN